MATQQFEDQSELQETLSKRKHKFRPSITTQFSSAQRSESGHSKMYVYALIVMAVTAVEGPEMYVCAVITVEGPEMCACAVITVEGPEMCV